MSWKLLILGKSSCGPLLPYILEEIISKEACLYSNFNFYETFYPLIKLIFNKKSKPTAFLQILIMVVQESLRESCTNKYYSSNDLWFTRGADQYLNSAQDCRNNQPLGCALQSINFELNPNLLKTTFT